MSVSIAQKKKKKKSEDSEMDPEFWMVTFGDLLSLLITFFVMLFAMSNLDDKVLDEMFMTAFTGGQGGLMVVDQVEEVAPSKPRPANAINSTLGNIRKLLNKPGVQTGGIALGEEDIAGFLAMRVTLKKRGSEFVMTFPSGNMFEPGSAQLNSQVKASLDRLGRILRFSNSDISIEGHTDDTPIYTRKYPSNWELSAARAVNVMNYFIKDTTVKAERIRALGFADTRPVVKNFSEKFRARNRRVEIVFRQAPGS